MTPQEINDQLELLRLKELFMSDIKIRSEFAHCTPDIATMLTKVSLYDVILTRKEIAAERKRLEKMKQ